MPIKTTHIQLLTVFISMIVTGCNNDIFVDRDDYSLKVSKQTLDYRGDSVTVQFARNGEEALPALGIFSYNETGEVFQPQTVKVEDSSHFDNGAVSFTAGYVPEKSLLTIKLDYNLCTDTVYIDAARNTDNMGQYTHIKIEPAAPSTIENFRYRTDTYSMRVDLTEGLKKLNVVNKGYSPNTYKANSAALTEYKISLYNPWFEAGIFNGADLKIPAAVVVNGEVKVLDDCKVPFSRQQGVIPGLEPEGIEPVTVTIPPRSLTEIELTAGLRLYEIRFEFDIVNSAIPGLRKHETGEFTILYPETIRVTSKSYDLEDGSEITQ